MADTNPARALDVVKRVVEMCDFIENPAIQEAIERKMVPRTMPPDVNAVVDISVWVGLGTVGLWAALDAFADRADLKRPECPTCKSKLCISARFDHHARGNEGESLKELDNLRHLYAHNYAGEADDEYFNFKPRHVLKNGVTKQLTCGAQFDGRRLRLDLTHLRRYSCTVRSVLERFS